MYLEGLGGSSEVLGRYLDVHRCAFGGPWGSLGVLGGSSGGPRGSLGEIWEAPKTDEVFLERLRRVLGLLGWFWCSVVGLGSVLGSQNVDFW